MSDAVQQLTRNTFVDKLMKMIPDHPLTQSQYLYYLSLLVFFGLLGYGLAAWYSFFTTFQMKLFFQGLFMTAIALISVFGLKQTRNTYIMTKEIYKSIPKSDQTPSGEIVGVIKSESKEEMFDEFKNEDKIEEKAGNKQEPKPQVEDKTEEKKQEK